MENRKKQGSNLICSWNSSKSIFVFLLFLQKKRTRWILKINERSNMQTQIRWECGWIRKYFYQMVWRIHNRKCMKLCILVNIWLINSSFVWLNFKAFSIIDSRLTNFHFTQCLLIYNCKVSFCSLVDQIEIFLRTIKLNRAKSLQNLWLYEIYTISVIT